MPAPIIAVFLADEPSTVDVIVSSNPNTSTTAPTLRELVIVQNPTAQLASQQHSALPLDITNTLTLAKGVYFLATDTKIQYSVTNGKCRVIFQNGKDPWPPPPPTVPLGTPLKMWENIYEEMFSEVVITVSDSPGKQWMVVSVEQEQAS